MPEWAERQLLHPEERRGREGKEGERGGREGWRPAGRQEPGATGTPSPQPRAGGRPVTPPGAGKGVIAGREGAADGRTDGRMRDWDPDKCALG